MGPSPAGLAQIEEVFSSIIFAAVGLGFIALLILLIFSGFKYLTSGGEPKALQSARDAMTWAFLGILFMVVAWIVLQLIGSFTNIKVTEFNIRVLCGPTGQFCSPSPTP